MTRYISTIIGLLVAVAAIVISLTMNVGLFELVVSSLGYLDRYQADEVIIPFVIILLFALYDIVRWQKRAAVKAEKTKLYLSMIAAVHHILNNFINQMQYFRLEAEKLDDFDKEILAMYGDILEEATVQVKKLSEIEQLDAACIAEAVYPKKKI